MRGQLHRGAVLLWRSAPCRDAALSRAVRSRGYAAGSICRCTINTGWVLHRGDAWPLRKRCTICLEECPFRRGEACLALLSHGAISPQGDACVAPTKNIHRHSERRRWGASVPAASTGARTRCNIGNPISLDGFVSRKIYCNCYRRRPPCELLSELEVGSDFFEPRENDLEGSCGVRGAAGCIDGHNGSPFSLQR